MSLAVISIPTVYCEYSQCNSATRNSEVAHNRPTSKEAPMTKKHKVSFIAEKKVKEPVAVDFKTKTGKKVTFEGHKKVKEPVRVSFVAKDKKR